MARELELGEHADFMIEECYKCGVRFCMTKTLHRTLQDQGPKQEFWCPNGHSQVYTESLTDKMRRERDRAIQEKARIEDEKREAERRADLAEARERRLKKRAAAGTCPCCKRSFSNMATHMRKQHPGYVAGRRSPEGDSVSAARA